MLKAQSEPPKPQLINNGPAWLALGFRPFFSAAGLSAAILLLIWLGTWSGGIAANRYYGMIGWHSHEMLFGYAAAIIAGFLLTAVRNWTGVNTPNGLPLAALALLWLAGRLAPLLAGILPNTLIAVIDLAFLPAVALAIRPALWQGQHNTNRIFVPLLLLMGVANLLTHLQPLGIANTATQGIDMMLFLVVLLMTVIGGRIIPFFSEAVGSDYRAHSWRWVEIGATASLLLLILIQLIYPQPLLLAVAAGVVALLQAVRLAGWYDRRIWRIPILWVLHTGYLWLVVGFVLLALAMLGLVGANLARHALTVGGIGILSFGMMARVSLGHTGRTLQPPRAVEIAFLLLNLAAVVRVIAPLLVADSYRLWIHLSGALWVVSFVLFCLFYLPMLFQPRQDGKPG